MCFLAHLSELGDCKWLGGGGLWLGDYEKEEYDDDDWNEEYEDDDGDDDDEDDELQTLLSPTHYALRLPSFSGVSQRTEHVYGS